MRIFDREIMIWNDGDLPRELSVQALKKKHPSVPRNKQIAEIFYYAGMIEQWGSGTRMMLDECKAAGMPAPTFEQVQGFRVTFNKPPQSREAHRPHESSRPLREKTRERILRVLRENPTITTLELSTAIGLSQKAIEWNIKKLKSARLMKRVGPDKGGHWEVAN